jgi:hypothetical protein
MTPQPPEQTEQPPRVLSADELTALRAAEQEFATDVKEVAEQSKARAGTVSAAMLEVLEATERRSFVQRMMETDLARELFAADARLARVFAVSGAFDDLKKQAPAQAIALAMTKIRLGRSWGLSEADAMQFIYFTNGRPGVMNEMIAAKLADAGWSWDIAWSATNGKCTGCSLYPKYQGQPILEADPADPSGQTQRRAVVSFLKSDADGALIWEKGKQIPLSQKWNFVSWPQDMYFWRAIIRLKRRYAPNILRGVLLVEEANELQPQEPEIPPVKQPRGSQAAADAVAAGKIEQLAKSTMTLPAEGTDKPAPVAQTEPTKSIGSPADKAPNTASGIADTGANIAATGTAQAKVSDGGDGLTPPLAQLRDFGNGELPDTFDEEWYRRDEQVYRYHPERRQYMPWRNNDWVAVPSEKSVPSVRAPQFGQKPPGKGR